jgi:hypothetical protein
MLATGSAYAALPDFDARYDISRYGVRGGEMHASLKHKNGLIYYRTQGAPTGVFDLFLKGQEIEESAIVKEQGGTLQPQQYDRVQKNSAKNKDEHYRFDWNAKKVQIDYRGKPKSLDLTPGMLDLLSVQLKLMQEAASASGSADLSYPVISRGKLRTYTYKKLKTKKIDTPMGHFDAVGIERSKQDEDSNTVYTLWFAPKLNYMPVRFENTENGKEVLTVELVSYKGRGKSGTE